VTVPSERDAAFERWVVPELASMYHVALAITRDHAEAEDLVQDSLIRAYRALDTFDGTSPRPWLLTILRNTHVNRHRRRRPGLLADPDRIADHGSSAPGPEIEVLAAVFDSQVELALRALPAEQQAVIELVDVVGVSYQQAAAVMGIPVGTVMSRLHRGRRRIKRKLTGVTIPVEQKGQERP
jgi:RNA polymerase sigma-70 factor (ECF subfamily)